VTAEREAGGRSVTRSSLIAAAGEALEERMHEYVPDRHDLSCARCEYERENWRHWVDPQVVVVILNPQAPSARIPREWASVQFPIPGPRSESS
jgi:hypothetical protein